MIWFFAQNAFQVIFKSDFKNKSLTLCSVFFLQRSRNAATLKIKLSDRGDDSEIIYGFCMYYDMQKRNEGKIYNRQYYTKQLVETLYLCYTDVQQEQLNNAQS